MAHPKRGIRGIRERIKLQDQFLEKLEQTANVTLACKKTKIARRTVYNWISTDETFKVKYEDAQRLAVDLLEDEARRRAFNGVREPVYQGGKRVGYITKYSDTLIIFLLKNLKKEVYRDTVRNEVSSPTGGPVETIATTTVISNVDYSKLSTEALEAIIAARIKIQD